MPTPIFISDNFTRSNATPISPTPDGHAYTTPFGTTARISSNHAGGASDDWAAIIPDLAAPGDFDWTYTFVTGTQRFSQATDIIDLYFRYQDANNRCHVELTSTTADESAIGAHGLAVYTYLAGSLTKIAEFDQTLYTNPGETHSLRAWLTGTTLKVYLDGILQITTTLTVLPTASGVGFHQRASDGYGTSLVGRSGRLFTRFIGWGAPITSSYSPVRVTGMGAEVLVRNTGYESRVTGVGAEVLVTNTGYESRATGVGAEVLVTNTGYESRVTGIAAQVLIQN